MPELEVAAEESEDAEESGGTSHHREGLKKHDFRHCLLREDVESGLRVNLSYVAR